MILTWIREVIGSNFGGDIDGHDWAFRGFPQYLQVSIKYLKNYDITVSFCDIAYSLFTIIQLFYATQSERLTAEENKLQIQIQDVLGRTYVA
jgi:hypothetical protein